MTSRYLKNLEEAIRGLGEIYFDSIIREIAEKIEKTHQDRKVVLIMGNGGSAADAQHWAGELNCTYRSRERAAIATIAITTDSSVITACANDFSYEEIFSRQIESYKHITGLVIGLTTSGKSRNIIRGLEKATELGIEAIGISGSKIEVAKTNNFCLNCKDTPTVQTIMQIIYHEVCENLEHVRL